MSTTKTAILALAQVICGNLGDSTAMDRLYGEVEIELAKDPHWWMMSHSQATPTVGDALLLTNTLELGAAFYGGRELTEVSRSELEATNPRWRDEKGRPRVFLREGIDNHKLRIYPQRDDTDLVGTEIDVFGTASTTTNIPDILAMPLALFVLAREFSRESNHRDMPFAMTCQKLGLEIMGMVA